LLHTLKQQQLFRLEPPVATATSIELIANGRVIAMRAVAWRVEINRTLTQRGCRSTHDGSVTGTHEKIHNGQLELALAL
jgi:hypothetical protein